MTMLLGSIEAGGTKMVCAVGNTNYQIKDSIHIPTTTPEETLGKIIDYFKQFDNLSAIGIASFGPIEIRRSSPVRLHHRHAEAGLVKRGFRWPNQEGFERADRLDDRRKRLRLRGIPDGNLI